jgi:hypothetical protein
MVLMTGTIIFLSQTFPAGKVILISASGMTIKLRDHFVDKSCGVVADRGFILNPRSYL